MVDSNKRFNLYILKHLIKFYKMFDNNFITHYFFYIMFNPYFLKNQIIGCVTLFGMIFILYALSVKLLCLVSG